jgi:hypothetical protein
MWRTEVSITYQDENGNTTLIDEEVNTHDQKLAIGIVYDRYKISAKMTKFYNFETIARSYYDNTEEE